MGTDEHDRRTASRMPITDLLKCQRREVILAAGCVISVFTLSYIASTYLTSYAATHLHLPKDLILSVGVLGGLVALAFTAVSAFLCDTVGRRRIILLGVAAAVPWSLVVMPLVDTGEPVMYALAIVGTNVITGTTIGPLASFIPEIFATRYRYTGAALSFNTGGILGGAVPPPIAAALLASFGSWAIGAMMAMCGLISFVCTFLLPETMGKTLAENVSRKSTDREITCRAKASFTRLRCAHQGNLVNAGFSGDCGVPQRYGDGDFGSGRRRAHVELTAGRECLGANRRQSDMPFVSLSRDSVL
jgi:MFS family permease